MVIFRSEQTSLGDTVINTVINPFLRIRKFDKYCLYRGADKSLARPGRKQATATEYFDFHISYL
jgi:hypothetical protein